MMSSITRFRSALTLKGGCKSVLPVRCAAGHGSADHSRAMKKIGSGSVYFPIAGAHSSHVKPACAAREKGRDFKFGSRGLWD